MKPKDAFKECAGCPEMVVIPAGEFVMGSPMDQGGSNERPQHKVTIASNKDPKPTNAMGLLCVLSARPIEYRRAGRLLADSAARARMGIK
jgi:hypothetical protein